MQFLCCCQVRPEPEGFHLTLLFSVVLLDERQFQEGIVMGFYPANKVAKSMSIRPAPYPAPSLPEGARITFLEELGHPRKEVPSAAHSRARDRESRPNPSD